MSTRILTFLLLISHQLVSTFANSTGDNDYLLLSSEKTPTLAPNVIRVTKKGSEPAADTIFESDCSEPLSKDVSCSVHSVACDDPIIEETIGVGEEPPKAHDVRIAPIAKVIGANRIDRRKHRLHVDISWQMPHQASSKNLRAFKLHVTGPNAKNSCFVFNVTHHEHDETIAPRFRFTTNTLFEFANAYTIAISSLPRSTKLTPTVTERNVRMPDDPDTSGDNHDQLCTQNSNPQASKWAASFRKIFLFSVARMIQVEFVAAPPQYCFEEYEVRLLDSSGIVMLQSAIIRRADLKTEQINGRAVQFGEHNFTGIDLDTDVIPSVIPIETSAVDGRCLCETENGCSCLAADWKPVKLARIESPVVVTNRTLIVADESGGDADEQRDDSKWHLIAVATSIFVLATFAVCLFCAVCLYRRFGKTRKSIDVRFVADNSSFTASGSAPLILKQSLSVLILYSHDSTLHDAAVLAFAELLRDVFHMDVHLDTWDEDEIEANRAEYINSSIVRADKIIIINSQGAYHRVAARHMRQPQFRRIGGANTMNDDIFGAQIDLALQHIRIFSVRFSYTPSKYTLFALSPLLQFTIPDNLNLLTASLTDNNNTANQRQLVGFRAPVAKLHTAIGRVSHFVQEHPDWFETTHCRVVVPPLITPIPSVDTNDTLPLTPMTTSTGVATPPAETEEIRMVELVDREEAEELEDEEEETPTFDSAYVSGSDYSGNINMIPEMKKKKRKIEHDEQSDSAFLDDVIA